MRLSMEIPKRLLTELTPLTDLDFALAHLVLEDEEYAKFYADQKAAGRTVIMDNSFHELGRPLGIGELEEAAKRINPSFLVAPDWLGDAQKTYGAWKEAVRYLRKWKLAVVLCGGDRYERADFFMNVRTDADMLCLPFKEPRHQWFIDLLDQIPRYTKWPGYFHLLGVNTLPELAQFRKTFEMMGIEKFRTSVDTSKPIKFGLREVRIDENVDLRGSGALQEVDDINDAQRAAITYNISFLRRYL